jgi:hypothetical protein
MVLVISGEAAGAGRTARHLRGAPVGLTYSTAATAHVPIDRPDTYQRLPTARLTYERQPVHTCRFSQRTFAGTRRNGRDAPIPAIRPVANQKPEELRSVPSRILAPRGCPAFRLNFTPRRVVPLCGKGTGSTSSLYFKVTRK